MPSPSAASVRRRATLDASHIAARPVDTRPAQAHNRGCGAGGRAAENAAPFIKGLPYQPDLGPEKPLCLRDRIRVSPRLELRKH